MKVLIVSPLATVAPHFETELEIAQRHLDDGDEVEYLACQGRTACCDFNASRERPACQSCSGRRKAGLVLLEPTVRSREIVADADDVLPFAISEIKTLDQLRALRWRELDLGWAALSSLVSLVRDPEPDLQQHRELLDRLLRSAITAYRATSVRLQAIRPDRVYVFNGRFAATRAVLRACQAAGVDCWIHERGCDIDHFQIYQNRLPHDIEYFQSRMREAWKNETDAARRHQLAESWFQDRLNRVERNWHSFVKDQTHGELPADWNSAQRNIALFTSSEDEFVSIGDSWRNPVYPDQLQGIRSIVRDLVKCDPQIHLYIRVHPNLKNVANQNLQSLLKLCSNRCTIIPPAAPCDTYHLMRSCEKVVTFGSSVGIEAVFWDRASILLGNCFYRNFAGVYQPTTHADAMRMIDCDLAPATDKTAALMYGFWFQTHGQRFQYFEADGLFSGRFKGRIVHAPHPKRPLLERWLNKLKRFSRRRAA